MEERRSQSMRDAGIEGGNHKMKSNIRYFLGPHCTKDHIWLSERASPSRNLDTWHRVSVRVWAQKVLQSPGHNTKHRTGEKNPDAMKLCYPEAPMQCSGTQYKILSLFPEDAEAVMSKWGSVAAHTHNGLGKNASTFVTGAMWHALGESCIRRKAVEDHEEGTGLRDTQMWLCVHWNQLFLAFTL